MRDRHGNFPAGAASKRKPGRSRPVRAPGETPTPFGDVTTHNNFSELGTDKSEPAANARTLRPRPWTVRIDGEVGKPPVIDVEQLLGWRS